jgi:carbon-monoxide dehydrogenase medium subunit
MIPTAFDYAKPATVDEALELLAADGAKAIAGGHSLLPLLKLRLAQVDRLVDIGGIRELKGIEAREGGARIGALTTYRQILDSGVLGQFFPMLVNATADIGDLQVRNKGTIGGAVAHADPASDMPGILIAFDATFVAISRDGTRRIPATDFFVGPFTTMLQHGELLLEILLPAQASGTGAAYKNQEQQASGYSIAGVAAVVHLGQGRVDRASIGVNGVADTPYRASTAERALIGTNGDTAAIAAAAAQVTAGVTAMSDIHAPGDYRAHLATVMAKRALKAAIEDAR